MSVPVTGFVYTAIWTSYPYICDNTKDKILELEYLESDKITASSLVGSDF
jgi:hypothetical protein